MNKSCWFCNFTISPICLLFPSHWQCFKSSLIFPHLPDWERLPTGLPASGLVLFKPVLHKPSQESSYASLLFCLKQLNESQDEGYTSCNWKAIQNLTVILESSISHTLHIHSTTNCYAN
jgi:hypothetical protein